MTPLTREETAIRGVKLARIAYLASFIFCGGCVGIDLWEDAISRQTVIFAFMAGGSLVGAISITAQLRLFGIIHAMSRLNDGLSSEIEADRRVRIEMENTIFH